MNHQQTIEKYKVFLTGVLCTALGICLITKAELGTSPVTSLSYVLTFIFPYSLGMFVLGVNSVMFVAEYFVLGKRFRRIQFLQLPATLIFSSCIDGWMWVLSAWSPQSYLQKIIFLLVGCVFLGLGIALEVIPDVLILPGEGVVRAISGRMGWDFGIVKTVFDVSLVVTALTISYSVLGTVVGIREGTVVAAVVVGSISRFFIRHITEFDRKHKAVFVKKESASDGIKESEVVFAIEE